MSKLSKLACFWCVSDFSCRLQKIRFTPKKNLVVGEMRDGAVKEELVGEGFQEDCNQLIFPLVLIRRTVQPLIYVMD